MVNIKRIRGAAVDGNLKRALEPLASYICASEQPKAVLESALAALVDEVERTDRAARAYVTAFTGGY
jgi:Flp pilus assembly protein TadD